ncbi:MAG: MFS transporter [Actinomycetota bacterium]|nr:MFS transporter [Actinomycetota bacterium]
MAKTAEKKLAPWRRPVAVLTVSHAVQHLYNAGIALTYPFVIVAFHTSYTTLGIYLTISGVLGGLLQGATWLVRKHSTRSVLGFQNFGLAVAAAAGAASGTLGLFGLARVFSALVYWPQHPLGSAYLTNRYPKRKGSVLAWHTTGGTIGTMAVPILLSVAIAAFGWRDALYLLAIPLALGGVYVATALARDRVDQEEHEVAARPLSAQIRALANRSSATILVASVISAAGRGLGVLAAYIPAYLHHQKTLSTIEIGVVFTVMSVGGIAGPLFAGWLADRIGKRVALLGTYVIGAIMIAAFILAGSSMLALSVMALLVGIFSYSESPLLQAMFADTVNPAESRQAFGLFFAIAFGIGSFWLFAIGLLIDKAGFHAAFYAIAASFAVAALVIATLPRAKRAANPVATA